MRKLKLAILDLYNDTPNQGMRAIKEIVARFEDHLEWQTFDVRAKNEIPDTSFDIYISSGGPGSPLDGDGVWNTAYFELMDQLWLHNKKDKGAKKFVFFICHSFQMICDHFDLARVLRRRTRAFGTFPAHMTAAGRQEKYFKGLNDPFCVADFRLWQVVQPDLEAFKRMGAKILALEKIRPQVPLERAIMAIRFSEEFFGVQFHPEADPIGLMTHFTKENEKDKIREQFGIEKLGTILDDLNNPDDIPRTYDTILPTFLDDAINQYQLSLAQANSITDNMPGRGEMGK